ncbi:MAG: DUF192 domain-containing protein [Pseudomonadota bacterium]
MRNTPIQRLLFAALAILIVTTACSAPGPAVELKGERFTVELADDHEARVMGLMFREQLDADAGMLFIFPDEERRSFWMKNCRINLDILYFDGNGRYVSGHFDVPPCRRDRCPSYPSTGPAKYVLELNGGRAADMNLTPGDELLLDL